MIIVIAAAAVVIIIVIIAVVIVAIVVVNNISSSHNVTYIYIYIYIYILSLYLMSYNVTISRSVNVLHYTQIVYANINKYRGLHFNYLRIKDTRTVYHGFLSFCQREK